MSELCYNTGIANQNSCFYYNSGVFKIRAVYVPKCCISFSSVESADSNAYNLIKFYNFVDANSRSVRISDKILTRVLMLKLICFNERILYMYMMTFEILNAAAVVKYNNNPFKILLTICVQLHG